MKRRGKRRNGGATKPAKVRRTLSDDLQDLIAKAKGNALTLGQVLEIFSRRGDAIIMVFLSLPFCQPIMIPGFSTPFGLALAILGAHYMVGRKPWLPRRLRDHSISFKTLSHTVNGMLVVTRKLEKLLHPRLTRLCTEPALNRVHGALIVACAILLSLPLPIPASNMLAALPILLIALGVLESDGVFVIAGYAVAALCLAAFGALAWLGTEGFERLLRWA
ncbi:MAG: exopolysaccharide biosynthesis protein [Candidatus Hydrogenedentes bacterium]|nr:exopolysaccharide biosynthesis protein [Candidatus Hydrogenedentota bacterium]